ncbi:MAG: hypothetical protein E6J87_23200, partial [Deltaproteobacteria bacterium]
MRITGDNSALRFETRVLGAALGPVSANAAVDQATGDTRGSLWLESASTGFLRDLGWRGRLSPVARAYSGPPLAFEILRDLASPQLRRIHIERSLAPRVEAALVWRSAPAKDPLPDVDVSADVPADALRGFLPEAAIASGNGTLRIRRSGGGAGFYGEADVTAISLADGAHIEKKPGEVLRVRMEGTAGERWDPLNLIFTGKDGSIPLAIGEHGLSAANLDVDLAAFSFMLVDGARAAGRLRGSFDYATRSAALSLDGVGLWLTPELGIERADGAIAINGGDWGVKELRVRGARMDATCDAAVQNERMIAKVTGARLDADYVRELLQQVRALHFAKYEPDHSPPLSGEIAVALDQASYGRSEGKHVTGVIAIDQRDVHARDLSFEIEDGRVAGRVDIDVRDGEPPLVDLEVDFADLTRRFVDDLFEEESRGNPGKYTGKLRFKAPWYGEKKATMAEANGSLAGIGRSGTLIGRLGLHRARRSRDGARARRDPEVRPRFDELCDQRHGGGELPRRHLAHPDRGQRDPRRGVADGVRAGRRRRAQDRERPAGRDRLALGHAGAGGVDQRSAAGRGPRGTEGRDQGHARRGGPDAQGLGRRRRDRACGSARAAPRQQAH